MEFLYFLESIRNPILDAIMLAMSYIGDETFFIVVSLIFLWCIDKNKGYCILFGCYFSSFTNLILKFIFRVPRPWVLDPNFKPVEKAISGAPGYSFPSSHTQISVGTYTIIGLMNRQKWVRIICAVLIILIPFSRMYLGVHTPLDVGVGFIISLILAIGLYFVCIQIEKHPFVLHIVFAVMTVLGIGALLYLYFYDFPADLDADNYHSGLKTAWTMFGAESALWLFHFLDEKYIHYETGKLPLLGQLTKLVIGALIVLGVKEGSKAITHLIFGAEACNTLPELTYLSGIRYFLVVVAAGAWTLTFPFWIKVFSKVKNKEKAN